MANFVRHEPCPSCGSRDNLGVYDDGSVFCFGCGYAKGTNRRKSQVLDKTPKPLNYPDDAEKYIPKDPLQWIKQYGILDKELVDHGVEWSNGRRYLLFPYFAGDAGMVAWQGRSFSGEGPKWFSRGDLSNLLHLIGDQRERVVIVEDIVSAIKVARHTCCCPIFGSVPSLKHLVRLSDRFKELVVWLDMDKHRESLKAASRASQLGFSNVRVISTEKDPKALTDKEIENALC